MEMVLDVDDIISEMQAIRDQIIVRSFSYE